MLIRAVVAPARDPVGVPPGISPSRLPVDRYLWTDANPIGRLPKRLGGPPGGHGRIFAPGSEHGDPRSYGTRAERINRRYREGISLPGTLGQGVVGLSHMPLA